MERDICGLCGRPLGRRREKHHWVPRSYGGRETAPLHPICHSKIHSILSERELAQSYHSPEALRGHPEIETFLRWLEGKPPDFHKPTRRACKRRRQ